MKNAIAIGFIAAMMALSLTGCGEVDKFTTGISGSSERCYKGVVYVNFTTGTSPVYRAGPNGEPLLTTC